jgi:hypothetical protein
MTKVCQSCYKRCAILSVIILNHWTVCVYGLSAIWLSEIGGRVQLRVWNQFVEVVILQHSLRELLSYVTWDFLSFFLSFL